MFFQGSNVVERGLNMTLRFSLCSVREPRSPARTWFATWLPTWFRTTFPRTNVVANMTLRFSLRWVRPSPRSTSEPRPSAAPRNFHALKPLEHARSRFSERHAMRVHIVWSSIESAMNPKGGQPRGPRAKRIPSVVTAAALVAANQVNPAVFDVGGNPSPSRILSMFKTIGIGDVFVAVKPAFDRTWGAPTAATFVRDTLQSIVDRRHTVAHTASTLNISRTDLASSIRFLRAFASALDGVTRTQLRAVRRAAI
jgi:RiboL-PSP-HEPN